MISQVELIRPPAATLAVVSVKTTRQALGVTIRSSLDTVYTFLRSVPARNEGINVVVYLDGEMNLRVGVQVPEVFESTGTVWCSTTPSGLAVHTAYFGPYLGMSEGHNAIHKWCKERGKTLAGPSWEVYGHWNDDPSKLRTDIYYSVVETPEPSAA